MTQRTRERLWRPLKEVDHKMPLRLTLEFSSVAGLKRGKHGFVLRSYAAVLCWHGAIVAGDVILVVCWFFLCFFHLIFNAHLSFM